MGRSALENRCDAALLAALQRAEADTMLRVMIRIAAAAVQKPDTPPGPERVRQLELAFQSEATAILAVLDGDAAEDTELQWIARSVTTRVRPETIEKLVALAIVERIELVRTINALC